MLLSLLVLGLIARISPQGKDEEDPRNCEGTSPHFTTQSNWGKSGDPDAEFLEQIAHYNKKPVVFELNCEKGALLKCTGTPHSKIEANFETIQQLFSHNALAYNKNHDCGKVLDDFKAKFEDSGDLKCD
ncbi:MAG: hypothetical protein MHMPM18_004108 [Marteilia pararefringens]